MSKYAYVVRDNRVGTVGVFSTKKAACACVEGRTRNAETPWIKTLDLVGVQTFKPSIEAFEYIEIERFRMNLVYSHSMS